MNKAEIKQIILEEIEFAMQDIETMGDKAEKLAADSLLDDGEEDSLEEDEEAQYGRKATPYRISKEKAVSINPAFAKMKPDEQKRAIAEFMIRVNNVLRYYRSKDARRPKARFVASDIKNLVLLFQKGKFTSSDIIEAVERYKTVQQANKFLQALRMKGFIEYADTPKSDDKGSSKAGGDVLSLDDLGLEEGIKRYIYKQIKEAKSPLASKMKDIEEQGRMAALETKLAAIQEMIDETQERLTRIDEDNEFNEMMDKSKVKDVRKQLKELERAKDKIEKERSRMSGKGVKGKKVVDEEEKSFDEKTPKEMSPEDTKDLALAQGGIPKGGIPKEGELEEETFELSESVKRMQKLANLRG